MEFILQNLNAQTGSFLAILGAAFGFFLAAMGSSKGVGLAGEAAAGVVSEDPGKFVPCMVLQAMPSTQAIYGFIITIMILGKINANLSLEHGFILLFAALPIGFVGFLSAIYQGRVAAAGINMVAKRPEEMVKGIILASMVEVFAIFALLISILLINNVG